MKFLVPVFLFMCLCVSGAEALFGKPTTAGSIEILMLNRAIADVEIDIEEMRQIVEHVDGAEQSRTLWGMLVARFWPTGTEEHISNPIINRYMEAYKAYMEASEQLESVDFALSNVDDFAARLKKLDEAIEEAEEDLRIIDKAIEERKHLAETGKPSITNHAIGVLFAKMGMGDTVREYDLNNRLHAMSKGIPALRKARLKLVEKFAVLKKEKEGIESVIKELEDMLGKNSAFAKMWSASCTIASGIGSAAKNCAYKVAGWFGAKLGKKEVETKSKPLFTPKERGQILIRQKELAALKAEKYDVYMKAREEMKRTYDKRAEFFTEKRAALVQNLTKLCSKKETKACVAEAVSFVGGQAKDVSDCKGLDADWDLVDMMGCLVSYEGGKQCKPGVSLGDAACQETVLKDLEKKFSHAPRKFMTCHVSPPKSPQDLADCALLCTQVGQITVSQFHE